MKYIRITIECPKNNNSIKPTLIGCDTIEINLVLEFFWMARSPYVCTHRCRAAPTFSFLHYECVSCLSKTNWIPLHFVVLCRTYIWWEKWTNGKILPYSLRWQFLVWQKRAITYDQPEIRMIPKYEQVIHAGSW